MRICIYILWINFAKSSPFRVHCGKKYAVWKRTPRLVVAVVTNMSYAFWVRCGAMWKIMQSAKLCKVQNYAKCEFIQGVKLWFNVYEKCKIMQGVKTYNVQKFARCKIMKLLTGSCFGLAWVPLLPTHSSTSPFLPCSKETSLQVGLKWQQQW